MRTKNVCPKCGGLDLLVVDELRHPDPTSGNATIVTRVHCTSVMSSGWLGVEQREDVGHVELWICEGCGYTERYAHDFRRLSEVADQPSSGVRRVRGRPPSYR